MSSVAGQTLLCLPVHCLPCLLVPTSALDVCSSRNWRGALFLGKTAGVKEQGHSEPWRVLLRLGAGEGSGWRLGQHGRGKKPGGLHGEGQGCERGSVATATSSLEFGPRLADQGSHVLGADLCPQNVYDEALTSRTSECDRIWRQGLTEGLRQNEVIRVEG